MNEQQEASLLVAFRLLSDKEKEMVLALSQRCADKKKDEPSVHVVLGYSIPRN
jgi:hypothetical protein